MVVPFLIRKKPWGLDLKARMLDKRSAVEIAAEQFVLIFSLQICGQVLYRVHTKGKIKSKEKSIPTKAFL